MHIQVGRGFLICADPHPLTPRLPTKGSVPNSKRRYHGAGKATGACMASPFLPPLWRSGPFVHPSYFNPMFNHARPQSGFLGASVTAHARVPCQAPALARHSRSPMSGRFSAFSPLFRLSVASPVPPPPPRGFRMCVNTFVCCRYFVCWGWRYNADPRGGSGGAARR